MRDNLSQLEFDLLMLVAPVLRKLAYAETKAGTLTRMTQSRTEVAAQEWIAHDPDPKTAAELAACSDDELAQRFAQSLTFGTAGLRGPLRGGPNGMNLAVVLRTTWAVAKVLKDRGLHGQDVVVGRRRQARLRRVRPGRRRSPCRPGV